MRKKYCFFFYHSNHKITHSSARAYRAYLGFESVSTCALHQRQQERNSRCLEQSSEQNTATGGDILTFNSQKYILTKIIFCDLRFMNQKRLHPCRCVLTPLINGSIVGGSRVGAQMLSTWQMFTRLPCQPWAGASTSLTLPPHLVLSRFICSVWANKSLYC